MEISAQVDFRRTVKCGTNRGIRIHRVWPRSSSSVFFPAVCDQLGNVWSGLEAAARALVRHRRYSVISIAGLSIAVTCCLLIALYALNELNYDRYHKNADRIYQLRSGRVATMPALLGPEIARQSPRVETAGLLYKPLFGELSSVVTETRRELANGLIFGNSELFDVFNWPFVARILPSPLEEPFTVVLTESAAARTFGKADPLGKTVSIANHDFAVTGVIEELPGNSHIEFDYIASIASADSMLRYHGEFYNVSSWR